jgi:hypothetical protein
VDVDHVLIVKKFEEKMNSNLKSPLEKQLTKKRLIMNVNAISNFLGAISLYKKDDVN